MFWGPLWLPPPFQPIRASCFLPASPFCRSRVLQLPAYLSPFCLPAGHQSVVLPSAIFSCAFPSQAGDSLSHCYLGRSVFSSVDTHHRLLVTQGHALGCAPSHTELLTPSLSPCSSSCRCCQSHTACLGNRGARFVLGLVWEPSSSPMLVLGSNPGSRCCRLPLTLQG